METVQGWMIGVSVLVLVAAFSRWCPRAKITGFLKPKMYAAGEFVSQFLTLRIGRKACEAVEEGVIVTVSMAISESIGGFVDGLLADNKKKKEPKK